MKRILPILVVAATLLVLGACGPVRKSVFPPLVSVQQLHVTADGQWKMQVRIQNNSYTGVLFTGLDLHMKIDGKNAGRILAKIHLDIPALSVDIADVTIAPSAQAARALAKNAAVSYSLAGTATALPDQDTSTRIFKVQGKDWFSPVPGLVDTWR
ncbi:hypothetical protein [Oleiagrimonas sp.]|jgi:predicted small lipoprotein YifL|uniref:hypothetical protein n=1 Tax=Oleiagrimonas sp. TaxID=2010330 RepID=UPI0026290D81|nr:hypothetical protein [Oleiagrimonas sp.]MDA3912671.1 hypothetical protein [Oleiagrimonas sp.]